ncbi:MAG: type III pantothenate kinase [Coraliomargarita sp.]
MKILCIDVGNTSAHYGLVEGQQVIETADFSTNSFREGPSPEFATQVSHLVARADGISFCSVVPAINENLKASFSSSHLPLFHLTHKTCNGLDLVYPKPEEIGQDRIANAIAAQEFFGVPAIVIDMGTAVTFDIVSSEGYEGGIIAPGLKVMTRYLHEQTALLPELDPKDLVDVEGTIGKSTVHAMKLGVALGFSGMINALRTRVVAELSKREGKEPVVLSTGGSMANLTQDWTEKSEFVENLTLMGLAVAFARNS